MKIYTLFSPTHTDLLYQYFIPSLFNVTDIDLVVRKLPQLCVSGEYGKSGWFEMMLMKVEFHILSCLENMGDIFIYSDCDVQFLRPFVQEMVDELGDYDIACQNDVHPYGNRPTYCAGLFICRANERTFNLFEHIYTSMKLNEHRSSEYNDQSALNANLNCVKHKLLSNKFYTIAQTTNKLWDNEYDSINIPKDILVHHANWTHGVANKQKLLTLIKENQK